MVTLASALFVQPLSLTRTEPMTFFDMVATLWNPQRQASSESIDAFLDEVKWFLIYYCIIGVIMFVFTYISIVLFNYAAHSQVRCIIQTLRTVGIDPGHHPTDIQNSNRISSLNSESRHRMV